MAYNKDVPSTTNAGYADLAAIKENFAELRRNFLSGLIPIDGANINYSYGATYTDRIESATVKIGTTTVASVVFTYNASNPDQLDAEAWTIDGDTYAVSHTWSGGKVTKTAIAITET